MRWHTAWMARRRYRCAWLLITCTRRRSQPVTASSSPRCGCMSSSQNLVRRCRSTPRRLVLLAPPLPLACRSPRDGTIEPSLSAAAVALSLTGDTSEFRDHVGWLSHERETLLPFVPGGKPHAAWPPRRLASALTVFVPALIVACELAHDDGGAAAFLRGTLLRSYGPETRAEAGLREPADAPPWRCESPNDADAAAAREGAEQVAARFTKRYARNQRPAYVILYLENVLPMVTHPPLFARGAVVRFASMLAFVDACLAPPLEEDPAAPADEGSWTASGLSTKAEL